MELILKNIGMLSRAKIELSGISVIAGENDTGKSTPGRVLFSLIHAFRPGERSAHEYAAAGARDRGPARG